MATCLASSDCHIRVISISGSLPKYDKHSSMANDTYTFTLFNNEPTTCTFSAGEVIFAEGDPGEIMYALLDGEVEIVRNGKVVETIPPGGVFGEMALLEKKPRSASAVARTESRLATITDKRFTTLVSQNPPFALTMMRLMSDRLRRNHAS